MFIVCVVRKAQAPSGAAYCEARQTGHMPLLTELLIAFLVSVSINMSLLRSFGSARPTFTATPSPELWLALQPPAKSRATSRQFPATVPGRNQLRRRYYRFPN